MRRRHQRLWGAFGAVDRPATLWERHWRLVAITVAAIALVAVVAAGTVRLSDIHLSIVGSAVPEALP